MDIQTLCGLLTLPPEVCFRLRDIDPEPFRELTARMTSPEHASDAYQTLSRILDVDDMTMLACQLQGAALVYDRYREMGIPDAVYLDTMKCFPRFLEETRRRKGRYCYDRAWWSYRQVSMMLFRIGQLEYELLPERRAVSLHIPSDACFTPEAIDRSLTAAGDFLARFFPDWAGCPYVCESWLLSRELGKLLKPDSNILHFQRRFRILRLEPGDQDVFQWLFEAGPDTPPEALPEKTSLQKNVKAHLLSGGHIGAALGVLNNGTPSL